MVPQGSTKAGTQLEELLARESLLTVVSFAGDCMRETAMLQLRAGATSDNTSQQLYRNTNK